jgi:hypothetical protein
VEVYGPAQTPQKEQFLTKLVHMTSHERLWRRKGMQKQYSAIFCCRGGSFPFKYLGIPMHYMKLSNKDWKLVEERIEKGLSS